MSFALTSARGEIEIGTASARAAIKGLSGDLKGFASSTMGGIGTAMTAFGAVLGAGFVAGISKAADFEQQMSAIQSVLSASDEQMAALSDSILSVGQSSSFTAGEVGQVAENLAKMGISAEDMVAGALQAVTNLAAATGTIPENAAMIVGQAMNQYQIAGDEAESVADIFTRTANTSAADVDGLGVSFSYAAGQAHALGIPIEDLMTSFAILADNGQRGSKAGTGLTRAFNTLLTPTKQAAEAMAKYNITALDTNGNFVGMPNLIDQLNTSFAGMTQSEKSAALGEIFMTNGARALLPLLNSQSQLAKETGKSWENYRTGVTSGLTASEAAAQRLDNLKGSVEKFKGSLDTILINLGTLFLGPIRAVVDVATMFTNALGNMSDASYALAAALAAPIAAFGALRVAALLAYNPLLRYLPGFDKFAAAASRSALPVAVLVGGMALLGLAYKKNFGGLHDWVDGVKDQFKQVKDQFDILTQPTEQSGIFDPATGEQIFNASANMKDLVYRAGLLGDAIKTVTGIDMKKWLQGVAGGLVRFPKAFSKLKTQLNQIGDVIKDKGLIAGIKDFFGEGGKGIAEAFGDGLAAVPKLFGDVLKGISTGNKTLDKILNETGKSFTDFGRLIQELGQGDISGFMDVLDRLGGRMVKIGGLVLDVAVSVVSDVAAFGWDWILDQVFGSNDIVNPDGTITSEPHKETLPDLIFELGVRVVAKFLGLLSWAGGKIGDLVQWAANEMTGKGGFAGSGGSDLSGLGSRSGQNPTNDATLGDVVFTIGVSARAVWNGFTNVVGDLWSWAKSQFSGGPVTGSGGSDLSGLDSRSGVAGQETIVDIAVKGVASFLGVFDGLGGAIGDTAAGIISWVKGKIGAIGDINLPPAKVVVNLVREMSDEANSILGGLADWISAQIGDNAGSGGSDLGNMSGRGGAAAPNEVVFTNWKLTIGRPNTGITIDWSKILGVGGFGGPGLGFANMAKVSPQLEGQLTSLAHTFGQNVADILIKAFSGGGDKGENGNLAAVAIHVVEAFFKGFAGELYNAAKGGIESSIDDFARMASGLGGVFRSGISYAFHNMFSFGAADAMAGAAFSGTGGSDLGNLIGKGGDTDPGGGDLGIGKMLSGIITTVQGAWDTFKGDLGTIFGVFSLPSITPDLGSITSLGTDIVNKVVDIKNSVVSAWNDFWSESSTAAQGPNAHGPMGEDFGFGNNVPGGGGQPWITGPDGGKSAPPDTIEAGIKFIPDTTETDKAFSDLTTKAHEAKVKLLVDKSAVDTIFGSGAGSLKGLFGGGSGQDVKVKIGADSSQFTNAMNSAVLAGVTFAGYIWTAHLNADYAGVINAYIGAVGYGVAWGAQHFMGFFDGDNTDAGNKYFGAVSYGDAWQGKTFTGFFDGDNTDAGNKYFGAMSYGDDWDGQVFTASFTIDTSGITAAVGVAQQAAAQIAALMPHSPAKEGPLKEPIKFDYIADEMRGSMGAMVGHAEAGVAATANALRSSGLTSDMVNGGLANQGAGARPVNVTNIVVNTMDPDHYGQLLADARFGREFGEAYYEELDLTE